MPESVITVMSNVSDLSLIKESLRGEGVDLQVVHSPEEALEMLAVTDSAVVVYDADTGQPWREAVPRFLRTRPGTRVILIATSADHRTWLDLFDSGAFDLILRPFRPTELRVVLRSALNPPRFFVRAA